MSDYMIRGTAADGQIRFFAAETKETVEEARMAHGLSPIATAALGRLLTGGAMMGFMMKNDSDRLTVKIDCQGPIEGLLVAADCKGHVKGYVKNPLVDLPSKTPGKLNVGDALDLGVLSVIRDIGLKEPYIGDTILQSGEIAEDLTYYFATSEQTPSSVALGVLMNKDNTVNKAGGFILQMMPGATDETITALEERLRGFTSVTAALENGISAEALVMGLLQGLNPEILDRTPVAFTCDCSKERTVEVIRSLPKEEKQSILDDGKDIEVVCHFCGKKYPVTLDEIRGMM